MASPHAAGTACLLLQADPQLKPAQIKTILLNSAVDLNAPANAQGSGRADVAEALALLSGDTPPPPPPPTPIPPDSGPDQPERKGCLSALFGR